MRMFVEAFIKLKSGRYINLLDPQEDQFTFGDISSGLSKICRFGGQCRTFYTVAEHSVLCYQQARDDGLSKDIQIALLMHDATEAFLGDCVKPLKNVMPVYCEIEKKMEGVIAHKFNIDFDRYHNEIKKIDLEMVIAEKNQFFDRDEYLWQGESGVREISFLPFFWTHNMADYYFTNIAKQIGIDTSK